jgi:hypothetical protein
MKEIFFHIGLHKTGTTFLQKKVFPNFQQMHFIGPEVINSNKSLYSLLYADEIFFDKSAFLSEIEKTINNKILFSDENFSGKPLLLNCINRCTIAYRIKELFPNAKILLFIRGQKEMLFSFYSQHLKNSFGPKRIGQFYIHPEFKEFNLINNRNINRGFENFNIHRCNEYFLLDCFKYFELINFYKTLFTEVKVILFEDFKSNPKVAISELETFFNETLSIKETIDYGNIINKGFCPKDFEKIYFHQKAKFLLRRKIISEIVFPFYKIFKSKNNFSKELDFVEKIATQYYKESNSNLQKNYPEINISDYPNNYQTNF